MFYVYAIVWLHHNYQIFFKMTKHRLLVKYVVDNVSIGTKVKKLYLQGINICDQLP